MILTAGAITCLAKHIDGVLIIGDRREVIDLDSTHDVIRGKQALIDAVIRECSDIGTSGLTREVFFIGEVGLAEAPRGIHPIGNTAREVEA